MKELTGSASTAVTATPEESVALLEAVDRYPGWYPDVIRHVEVLERDAQGVPRRARTTVHLSVGPGAKDFQFDVAVETRPGEVVIRRLGDTSDPEQLEIRWSVAPREVSVNISARFEVPRFLPVGGVGDSVAQGFVEAARRVLDGSSPQASASSS